MGAIAFLLQPSTESHYSLSHVPAQHPMKSVACCLELVFIAILNRKTARITDTSDAAYQTPYEAKTVMRDFARDGNLAWAEHWLCREESHSSRSQLI